MTLPLSNCAELVLLEGHAPSVQFKGRHYAREDSVPFAILGNRYRLGDPMRLSNSTSAFTAATFVVVCMSEDFGMVKHWPALAVEFLAPDNGLGDSTSRAAQSLHVES